jgi:hypothetical protein
LKKSTGAVECHWILVRQGTVDKCPHQAAYPDNATTQQCETITKKSTSVKVYCTTVCVSSATVADDAQYVEQCECDSATVVCPVHRSKPCDCHKWTTIGRKGRSERPGRLPRLQASTLDGLGSNG